MMKPNEQPLQTSSSNTSTTATATTGSVETPRVVTQRIPQLDDPDLYLNRELAWLAFNERVLGEAETKTTPLLERLKFIIIFHSNLDEFFMVRLSGLLRLVEKDKVGS